MKRSDSLLPTLIHIAGSFAVCMSGERLTIVFTLKAIDFPYSLTSDML